MYSLNCPYYDEEFTYIEDLVEDALNSGIDPNFEITRDGKPTGERLTDHLIE